MIPLQENLNELNFTMLETFHHWQLCLQPEFLWLNSGKFLLLFFLADYYKQEVEMVLLWKFLFLAFYHPVLSETILFNNINSKVSWLRVTEKLMLSDKQKYLKEKRHKSEIIFHVREHIALTKSNYSRFFQWSGQFFPF